MRSGNTRSNLYSGLAFAREKMLEYAGLDDPWRFYELIRRLACQVRPLEALYICRYFDESQQLFFVHLAEKNGPTWRGSQRSQGRMWPLGNGPTSWVVRHRRPFVYVAGETSRHIGVRFLSERSNRFALHVPIQIDVDQEMFGVLGLFADDGGRFDEFWTAAYETLTKWTALSLAARAEGRAKAPPYEARSDFIEPKADDFEDRELYLLVMLANDAARENIQRELSVSQATYYRLRERAMEKVGLHHVAKPELHLREQLKSLKLPITISDAEAHLLRLRPGRAPLMHRED